jgi:hypothetical protein
VLEALARLLGPGAPAELRLRVGSVG